jgi:Xaa-Pro aminopeptidase
MSKVISHRVEQLRQWLANNQLDALLIPHEDEYLGEYLPEHNERLHWATGFTGSAGVAVITADKAAMFVDGRYTVQVTKQVPADQFEYRHLHNEPAVSWLLESLPTGSKVAIDPRFHSNSWFNNASETVSGLLELVSLTENPIDTLWSDRPTPKLNSARLMGLDFVGQSCTDKRTIIAKQLSEQSAKAALLTQLDSVCWLLNVRGSDIPRLPVMLSHAIIYSDSSVDFFVDADRLPADFESHVGSNVRIQPPVALEACLQALSGQSVLVDSSTSNAWASQVLTAANANIIEAADPCDIIKAQKNATEIAGMKACHIRDGVAMTKFLSWLDAEIAAGRLHDEAVLSDKLLAFRQLDDTLADLSFDTISAAAANAAMCHYNHINQQVPGKLEMNNLYLVDSGGQYPDGTTDITRTIAVGTPSDELKQQFTLVLKGHIALALAKFPKGTSGHQLDMLARQFLWAKGFDFDHSTGHGVGHFLNVHEGPQSIGKKVNTVALLPGMVLSNEPGYYRADAFGIRIENLELVVEVETDGDFSVLGFESLTRTSIDKRLINTNMLTRPELSWLNGYHQKVWDDISPLVDGDELEWLRHTTSELSYE